MGADLNDLMRGMSDEAAHAWFEEQWREQRNESFEPKDDAPARGTGDATPLRPAAEALPWSHDRLADRFAQKHADDLRYVASEGRWRQWDGTRWRLDDTLLVFDRARALCRRVLDELGSTAKEAALRALGDAATVAAIEKLARSDRRLAATAEAWDADPWILNTPGGIVELRTGRLRAARPEDRCTKTTAEAPAAPGTDCPRWRAFLDRVTGGDWDLRAYLQRLMGYSLTGLTVEQMLAFLHGTGANGKGVFLNTTTAILGDYATTAPAETFEAAAFDRHPTELALLRGARLVTAQETEEGRKWAEARIKALTGGDPITARFMRGDFFTFRPSFTLLIAGNHKPGLNSVDEAMRRRLHLVPFTVTIPPEERDPKLGETLKAEGPAILRWMIEGCLAWQKEGLRPPSAVLAATAEYLDGCDLFAEWLSEGTEPASDWERENSCDLFASWKGFAERAGEKAGTMTGFADRMKARGFEKKRATGGNRGFQGIRLKRPDYTDDRRGG